MDTAEQGGFSALGDWASMVAIQHNRLVGINKASFQSAAKQYILKAVQQNSNIGTNETYIILLSDEKVNGVDDNYQLEWNNISTSKGSRIAPYREEVFSKLKILINDFFSNRLNFTDNTNMNLPIFLKNRLYLPSIKYAQP